MPHPENTENNVHKNEDFHNDNRLHLRSEEVQEILGRPPRRIVRWRGGVKINFQKTGNVLIFCLTLQFKIFRMFEARSTKHEARSRCCLRWNPPHCVEVVQS